MNSGLYIITDGAWKGKSSLKAGSGCVIYNIDDETRNVTSHQLMYNLETYEISHIEYEVLDAAIPAGKYRIEPQLKMCNIGENNNTKIFTYKLGEYMKFHIHTTGIHKKRTNNRAEYLAYIFGNIVSQVLYPNTQYTLITDSMLLLNTLKTWLSGWIKKGIVLEKENSDLLNEFIKLPKPKKYVHINSHLTPAKFQKLTPEEKEYSKLNDLADDLANEAIIYNCDDSNNNNL